jgi:hypothetical protein
MKRLSPTKGITIYQSCHTEEKHQSEDQVAELLDILALLLEETPQGFSEHQLLSLLQQPPHTFFARDAMRDPLILFQSHFLLFHCLYLLRKTWRAKQYANIEISALNIQKTAFNISHAENNTIQNKPTLSDPLAQYYLDWSQFSSTTSNDVDELLNGFWKKMQRPQQQEDIQQALILMELESPIPLPQLKVQYRRLAQRHHPDKGGDSEHFKKICQAFHQLKQYAR